jgi:pyruvate formate lyase activating enzyme
MSADEVFHAVMRDREYYGSDGGVTVSGGEPLLYPEFTAQLFHRLQEEGIHTALDTCGEVPFSSFEKVLPFTSLVLYDLKGMDPVRHQKNTGRSNQRILENLRELGRRHIPVEIRIPLIPEHNDSPEELKAAADFLQTIPSVTAVKVLPFHNMARNKYRAAGMTDTTPDVEPPDDELMQKAAGIFASAGLTLLSD